MRWYNHKVTTAATVFAVTGDLAATSLSVIGSIVPDAVEMPFSGLVKHRGFSHWPYLYLIPVLCLWGWYKSTGNIFAYVVMFFLVGCCLHLMIDVLSPGGIPFGRPNGKRRGLSWYRPFGGTETMVALSIVTLAWYCAYLRGFYAIDYLVAEIKRSSLLVEYVGRSLFS